MTFTVTMLGGNRTLVVASRVAYIYERSPELTDEMAKEMGLEKLRTWINFGTHEDAEIGVQESYDEVRNRLQYVLEDMLLKEPQP